MDNQPGERGEGGQTGPVGVRVNFLGRADVEVGGYAVTSWGAGKARALFQHLICRPGRVFTKGALLDVLWADEGLEPGTSSLKVAAHGVRTTLRLASQHLTRPACTLESAGCGYVLQLHHGMVDSLEFERCLSQYRTERDPDREVTWLTEAVALYRGPFLPGESALWVLQRRQWYRSQALLALSGLRRRAAEQRKYDELRLLCEQTLAIDICNEGAYRALMGISAAHGETSEARRWFEVCRAQLRGTLGVEPAEVTLRLAQRYFPLSWQANPAPVGTLV
jgi:DNA-binding SARP family transcriptional activator